MSISGKPLDDLLESRGIASDCLRVIVVFSCRKSNFPGRSDKDNDIVRVFVIGL
jgi:hypothetical protein